jgi:choline dehydrogenase-like flavoprotein
MHLDARNIPDKTLIEGDLCIIGTGPAGLSIAMEWDNMPQKVILLEGGGFDYDDKVQDLYDGHTTGQTYFPLKSTTLHYFGGASNHWGGFCSPLDDIDFERRPWVPYSGWPIKKSDLDPFYARAHPVVDLGPCEYDIKKWQQKDPGLLSLLPENPTVYNKVWQFSPPTRFGPKYAPAVKGSRNIHLYTYANVTEITANEHVNTIESVTVTNFAGRKHTVKAKRFVLACGAIQNARVLLANNKQAPQGLGNDNDLVGRFFMDHLELSSAWLHLAASDPLKLYMMEVGRTKMRCELAISPEMQAKHAILNGTSSLKPAKQANLEKPNIKAWDNPDPRKNARNDFVRNNELYRSLSLVVKAAFGVSRYSMATRIEQAPNPDSRVTLDKTSDALGMPRAHLNWELTPLERRSIRTIYELIARQLGSADMGRIQMMDYLQDPDDASWPDFAGGGWHQIGTTRMSDDPHTGVVDADCKVHGINNLYIAGSSCFVTSGGANPTLTIVALSLRLSDHLKRLS